MAQIQGRRREEKNSSGLQVINWVIKMKLYINTGNSEKTIVGFNGKKIEMDARKEKSQQLLEVIESGIKKRGKSVQDVKQIEVNLGPGSFTGLRVGVSVANALGWVLSVPVNGKPRLAEPLYGV